MEALTKQLEVLNQTAKQFSQDMHKLHSERRLASAEDKPALTEQILGLQRQEQELNIRLGKLEDRLRPDTDVSVRDEWDAVHAACTISGPNGSFDADVLLDSDCTMELKLSRYKADQIGLEETGETSVSISSHGTQKAITKRSPATVDLFFKNSAQVAASAELEVWVQNDTSAPNPSATTNAPASSLSASSSASGQSSSQSNKRQKLQRRTPRLRLTLPTTFSPVKDSKDKHEHHLSLGWPAVKKLRLGIDPGTSAYVVRHKDHRG